MTRPVERPTEVIERYLVRGELEDLIRSYTTLIDRGRIEEVVGLFEPEGRFQFDGGQEYQGPAAILDFFRGRRVELAGHEVLQHHVSDTSIELTGKDTARARSYFIVMTESGLENWGRFLDEFARRDGRWYFTRRRVIIVGSVAATEGEAADDVG